VAHPPLQQETTPGGAAAGVPDERGGEPGQARPRQPGPTAREAAARARQQGLTGTDLGLAALGPALALLGQAWPLRPGSGRGRREASVQLTELLGAMPLT